MKEYTTCKAKISTRNNTCISVPFLHSGLYILKCKYLKKKRSFRIIRKNLMCCLLNTKAQKHEITFKNSWHYEVGRCTDLIGVKGQVGSQREGRYSTNVYTGRLRLEVQPQPLIYHFFFRENRDPFRIPSIDK